MSVLSPLTFLDPCQFLEPLRETSDTKHMVKIKKKDLTDVKEDLKHTLRKGMMRERGRETEEMEKGGMGLDGLEKLSCINP